MLEDALLVLKMKQGNSDAVRRVYEKYKIDLLSLALALLHDVNTAEDVVHDTFLSFVESIDRFHLTGSLKGYLLTCVANRCRDKYRMNKNISLDDNNTASLSLCMDNALQSVISSEELQRLRKAIAKLPYEQKEAVILHLQARKTFRQIAKMFGTSTSTVQSRYRYGISKLRELLDSEVKK